MYLSLQKYCVPIVFTLSHSHNTTSTNIIDIIVFFHITLGSVWMSEIFFIY